MNEVCVTVGSRPLPLPSPLVNGFLQCLHEKEPGPRVSSPSITYILPLFHIHLLSKLKEMKEEPKQIAVIFLDREIDCRMK